MRKTFIEAHLPDINIEFNCTALYRYKDAGFEAVEDLYVWDYNVEQVLRPNQALVDRIEAYIDAYILKLGDDAC